jgi:hypothetical protein
MEMLSLVGLVLLAIAPDVLLTRLAPTWLARLAFRRVPVTRRFVLARGPRVPADRPSYREDALPRGGGEIPRLLDTIELGDGRIIPDGPNAFVLVARPPRTGRFIVRIEAHVERGEIVLRARQAPALVVSPFVAMAGIAWLYTENPGREVGVAIAGVLSFVLLASVFALETSQRDLRTAAAMQLLESEMRAVRRAEASTEATTAG